MTPTPTTSDVPAQGTAPADPILRRIWALLAPFRGELLLVAGGHRQQELGDDVGQLRQPDVEGPTLLHLGLEPADPAPQVERPARPGGPEPVDGAAALAASLLLSHRLASIPR